MQSFMSSLSPSGDRNRPAIGHLEVSDRPNSLITLSEVPGIEGRNTSHFAGFYTRPIGCAISTNIGFMGASV